MTYLDNHGEAIRLVEHLDGQVNTLLRENERLRAAIKKIEGDLLEAGSQPEINAIARYAHAAWKE